MTNFWWNVLAAGVGQAITFLLYQGFVNSYWGKNIREELTRFFDSLSKHARKDKENAKITSVFVEGKPISKLRKKCVCGWEGDYNEAHHCS